MVNTNLKLSKKLPRKVQSDGVLISGNWSPKALVSHGNGVNIEKGRKKEAGVALKYSHGSGLVRALPAHRRDHSVDSWVPTRNTCKWTHRA